MVGAVTWRQNRRSRGSDSLISPVWKCTPISDHAALPSSSPYLPPIGTRSLTFPLDEYTNWMLLVAKEITVCKRWQSVFHSHVRVGGAGGVQGSSDVVAAFPSLISNEGSACQQVNPGFIAVRVK